MFERGVTKKVFKMTDKEYADFVAARAPSTRPVKNVLFAFLVGGGICVLGQGLTDIFIWAGLATDTAKLTSTVSLVFLSALLTALHVYDDIARFAGAGIVVPITGFANAVASPAIEFKTEGFILGVGAKMFVIAGPVIVYGVAASAVYGLIYWLTTLL